MTINPIEHILKHEGKTLQQLILKLDELKQLQALFTQYLEPKLAEHCHVVKIENNRLIVLADSGSWTTQLQFHIPHLLVKLRSHSFLQNLQAICCKTHPNYQSVNHQAKKRKKPEPFSKKTAENILETAEKIQDTKIKNILEKMARRFL